MKCVAFWPHALDESGGSLHVDRLWNAAAIVFAAEVHQSLADPQNAFGRGGPINRLGRIARQRATCRDLSHSVQLKDLR